VKRIISTTDENLPLELNRGEILRHPLLFLKSVGPFLTAHHPFCLPFETHTIKLRERQWCIGCTFNNVSFFAAFGLLLTLWLVGFTGFSRFFLFYGGLTGSLISIFFGQFKFSDSRKGRLIRKLILGSSFALVSFSILIFGGSIFYMFKEKFLFFVLIYYPLFSIMSAKRLWEVSKTCNQCEYSMKWSKCPGFHEIVSKLGQNGFLMTRDENLSAS